jgi:hypothetical protein
MHTSNDIGLLDREKLLKIFEYLNERLKENQLQLEITVYGGSVMTMVYDNRPATKDIDCVFSKANSKLMEKILAARAEPAKDFTDAYILCKDLNITTKSELLKTISAYIPLTLLGERQKMFIKYLGEDLGYDWE